MDELEKLRFECANLSYALESERRVVQSQREIYDLLVRVIKVLTKDPDLYGNS